MAENFIIWHKFTVIYINFYLLFPLVEIMNLAPGDPGVMTVRCMLSQAASGK